MKSCDTCDYFVRLKQWVGRIGICDFEDGSLGRVIKQCQNYKSKKYSRLHSKTQDNSEVV